MCEGGGALGRGCLDGGLLVHLVLVCPVVRRQGLHMFLKDLLPLSCLEGIGGILDQRYSEVYIPEVYGRLSLSGT